MINSRPLYLVLALLTTPGLANDDKLAAVISGDHRNKNFAARDVHRHPAEVLEFFGLKPDQAVAEIWPSSGWWSEILAPYLKEQGTYYAVGYSLTANRTPTWRKNAARQLIAHFDSHPELYGNTVVTSMSIPEDAEIAPPGSLDLVLTFRNVHNWMNGDYAPAVFDTMYAALKPGGRLGLVEHRAPAGASMADIERSGYVTEAHVIAMAEGAGFELEARSEINANPRDSHDHEAGVWTLPPSMRLCRSMDAGPEQAACMERYQKIGESDRMTLKFRKPA